MRIDGKITASAQRFANLFYVFNPADFGDLNPLIFADFMNVVRKICKNQRVLSVKSAGKSLNYLANIFLSFILTTSLISCSTNCKDCAAAPTGIAYFPLKENAFIEYDVQEDEFALGRAPVSRTYQLKELIVEKYTDATGQSIYRIVRFSRANTTQNWQTDSTLTIRLTANQAIRNENSRDFVKMVFPVYEKSFWNGNAYNNGGEDKYELQKVGKLLKINGQTFENTATVVQQNDSTLVGQDKRTEIYAANVGLIYREKITLQFCSSAPNCVGKGQIDYGLRQIIRFKKAGE